MKEIYLIQVTLSESGLKTDCRIFQVLKETDKTYSTERSVVKKSNINKIDTKIREDLVDFKAYYCWIDDKNNIETTRNLIIEKIEKNICNMLKKIEALSKIINEK